MNTTKRNPKKAPQAGDMIWRPAGADWRSVTVQRVDDGLVEYSRTDMIGEATIVPLADWREHTVGWRLSYPRRVNPMRFRHEYPESYVYARGPRSAYRSGQRNA
jgi:hypothetical protein